MRAPPSTALSRELQAPAQPNVLLACLSEAATSQSVWSRRHAPSPINEMHDDWEIMLPSPIHSEPPSVESESDAPKRSTPIMLRPGRRLAASVQSISTRRDSMTWDDLLEELDQLERASSTSSSASASPLASPTASFRRGRSASYPARLDEPWALENDEAFRLASLPATPTNLDVMVEAAGRASAGSRAAREFFDVFGKLDGPGERNPLGRDSGRAADGWKSCLDVSEVPELRCPVPRPPVPAGYDTALLTAAERRLPRVMAELQRGIARGLCSGAQLSCSLPGGPPLHLWVGEVRKGQPFRRDILCNWMSTTKPVTVVAIAQLWERGLLGLSEPVASYIPEFGCNGKEGILLEHLLTHTAGIPYADVDKWTHLHEWDSVIEHICDATIEPGWEPGKRAGYHPYSAWFVLGEIVRRIDGRPFAQYVREEIFLPLGMPDCYVGMSAAEYQRYADDGRIAELRTLAKGGRVVGKNSHGTSPNEVMACVPGANGRGPADQWLRLFQMLVDEARRSQEPPAQSTHTARSPAHASRSLWLAGHGPRWDPPSAACYGAGPQHALPRGDVRRGAGRHVRLEPRPFGGLDALGRARLARHLWARRLAVLHGHLRSAARARDGHRDERAPGAKATL